MKKTDPKKTKWNNDEWIRKEVEKVTAEKNREQAEHCHWGQSRNGTEWGHAGDD